MLRRNQVEVTQPLTVIRSKGDGIVGWGASEDPFTPHAKHVEVRSSHLGLGINAEVWRVIAEALAES